jgi:hypothetical protein
MTWWITTMNENRLAEWDNVLGMDKLPVTTARPILIRKGGLKRPYYMIDAQALTMVQRMRLVGFLWRTKYISTIAAIAMVESGVLVDGRDCEVLEPVEERPLAYLYGRYTYAT